MASLLRFLALCLLLNLSLPAIAGTGIGKDELDAQKELLLLKIDSNKEVLQKDLEAQSKRIDAVDKRVDDQVNRFGDLGFFAGVISSLITVVLALGGIFGYLSVAKKAREEAETASKKWFDDNHQTLEKRIQELEHAAARAHETINSSVADVETHRQSAMETMQKSISSGTDGNPNISAADAEGLRASVKQLKDKPEASYSYDDWNTRAFAAYQAKQFEDAALFWKYAAEVPNAGATNTTQALFNRAVTLSELKRGEEAIATYTQLIDTYRTDTAPAIREWVARAMLNKAVTLGQMEKSEEENALYDQLVAAYTDDDAPALREHVARAILNKAATVGQMGKHEEAIALSDQLIAAYTDDTTPALRENVARAMFNKTVALGKKGKNDEKIALYDQMIATYTDDTAPALRELVTRAMLNKAVTLGQMGKHEEEIALYDQLIAAYADDTAPALREQVARAMFNKAVTLGQIEKNDKEIALYDQLIAAYADDTAPALREQVAKTMLNKAVTLGQMGKNEEKIALYDQLIATYANETAPSILEQVARALNGTGFDRLMAAKQGWANRDQALAALQRAEANLQACLTRRPHWGIALGNLAYVLWLLQRPAESEAAFRAALKSTEYGGEQLYKATLEDIAQHPIPEDDGFKSMVERLWAEHKAELPVVN